MNNYSSLFPTQSSERQQIALQFGLRKLRYLLSSDEEPEAELELEALAAREMVTGSTATAALSDEVLDVVAGGYGLPAEGPGKLRQAAACYLHDSVAEATSVL